MQTTKTAQDDLQHIITLPNGEQVDLITDLVCCGTSAGFDYINASTEECADFLADWYGAPDENLQSLIGRDELAALILSEFAGLGWEVAA